MESLKALSYKSLVFLEITINYGIRFSASRRHALPPASFSLPDHKSRPSTMPRLQCGCQVPLGKFRRQRQLAAKLPPQRPALPVLKLARRELRPTNRARSLEDLEHQPIRQC